MIHEARIEGIISGRCLRKQKTPPRNAGRRKSHQPDSNRRPKLYESFALPTELWWREGGLSPPSGRLSTRIPLVLRVIRKTEVRAGLSGIFPFVGDKYTDSDLYPRLSRPPYGQPRNSILRRVYPFREHGRTRTTCPAQYPRPRHRGLIGLRPPLAATTSPAGSYR